MTDRSSSKQQLVRLVERYRAFRCANGSDLDEAEKAALARIAAKLKEAAKRVAAAAADALATQEPSESMPRAEAEGLAAIQDKLAALRADPRMAARRPIPLGARQANGAPFPSEGDRHGQQGTGLYYEAHMPIEIGFSVEARSGADGEAAP